VREIKFRAWEKNLKEIIPVYNIDFEKRMINIDFAWRTFDEVELIQFTGLYDKHHKPIYEGDIVKGFYDEYNLYFNETNRIEFISDVKRINNGFGVRRLTANYEGRLRDYGYQLFWDAEKVEVIGNIYENKHLLEGAFEWVTY